MADAKLAYEIDRACPFQDLKGDPNLQEWNVSTIAGIKNVLRDHLPCPAEHILKLCTEGERYSYELVLYADRDMMERGGVPNEERIAIIVSERMLKVRVSVNLYILLASSMRTDI